MEKKKKKEKEREKTKSREAMLVTMTVILESQYGTKDSSTWAEIVLAQEPFIRPGCCEMPWPYSDQLIGSGGCERLF